LSSFRCEILGLYSFTGFICRHGANCIAAHRENYVQHTRPIRLSDDGPSLFSSNDVVVDVHLVVGEHLLDFLGSYVVNGDVPRYSLGLSRTYGVCVWQAAGWVWQEDSERAVAPLDIADLLSVLFNQRIENILRNPEIRPPKTFDRLSEVDQAALGGKI